MVEWDKLKKNSIVEREEFDEETKKLIKRKYKVKDKKQTEGGGRVIYMISQ